jgi:asparagine synthase (glutamine-hydrolysing)
MCGILAAVSPAFSRDQADRALSSLRHRGPDGTGTWRNASQTVLLGQTRLSIIDLEGGRQPMLNEAGDIAVVVNGEFYGYEAIARDLCRRGHRFRTQCDSEILVHLYEEHGVDAVHHLRGEFAFAIWDERHARLIAGRDRFGVKPLFYSIVDDGMWLASEAKALFAAGLQARWDEEAFYQHLFLIHDADRSLFDGVRQVPAGHLLVFADGHARTTRYWDLDYPRQEAPEASPEPELIEEFGSRVEEAVRVRLRADIPVGYFLSGGLDSSAVVSYASRHWHVPGLAFTVGFDEAEYDERDQARRTAASIGAEFAEIPLSDAALVEAYPAAVAQAETIGNLHAAARYLQSRAVHEAGYKVVLTGDGADEVLAGYLHYRFDALESERDVPAALAGMKARLGHVPRWVSALAVERAVFPLLLAPDYRQRMRTCDPYTGCLDAVDCEGQLLGRSPLHQSLYLWNKAMLPNYVLGAERLEMAFSVETRPPFLDHLLFETIRRFPAALLIRDQSGKWPLRRVATGLVPDAVVGQQKHPFAAGSGLSRSLSPLSRQVDEMLRGGMLEALPFFDVTAVRAFWAQCQQLPAARRAGFEAVLLVIVCACVLHHRYIRA